MTDAIPRHMLADAVESAATSERSGAADVAAKWAPDTLVGSGGSAQCKPAWEQEGAPASDESLLVRRLRALAAHLGYVEPEDDPPGHSEDAS